MKVVDVLKAARAKIAKPENWTQGRLASDADGQTVDPDDSLACRFCSIGAIASVARDQRVVNRAFNRLREAIGVSRNGGSVGFYNDTHTHERVVLMFDRAIAAEESK